MAQRDDRARAVGVEARDVPEHEALVVQADDEVADHGPREREAHEARVALLDEGVRARRRRRVPVREGPPVVAVVVMVVVAMVVVGRVRRLLRGRVVLAGVARRPTRMRFTRRAPPSDAAGDRSISTSLIAQPTSRM